MKATNQKIAKVLLLGLVLFLAACSQGQSDSNEFASRTITTTTTDSASQYLAMCNYGLKSDIGAKLKAYADGSSIRMDLVTVRMTTLPSDFSSSTKYIAMFRWLANSTGSTYIDSTALQFILVDSYTGAYLTGWRDTIRWSDVSTIASNMSLTTPAAFFNRVNIIVNLKDTQGEYDVLKIATYNASTNTVINQMDALLPLFAANPNTYNTQSDGTTRPNVLRNLHPFKDQAASGWSSSQYVSMANSYCF